MAFGISWMNNNPYVRGPQQPQTDPLASGMKAFTDGIGKLANAIAGKSVSKASTVQEVPTSASSASAANIVANTPAEGNLRTGEIANNLFNKMMNAQDVKISVISDDISALMSKTNRTPEETQQMMSALSSGFQKLGGSMTKFISAKYGDGSETISKEAFMKFQNEGLSDAQIKSMEESNNNIFNRLDHDGDGVISEKEMSAFYYALDFNEKNQANGAIDSTSYYANMYILDQSGENIMDKKIDYAYKTMYGNEE